VWPQQQACAAVAQEEPVWTRANAEPQAELKISAARSQDQPLIQHGTARRLII
jgi:hypothetical protein